MAAVWAWNVIWCAIMISLLYKFVDWRDIRKFWVGFLAMQTITWSVGLTLVNSHLVEYPVRLFPGATHQNFVTGYFIYPSLSVLFNQYFPRIGRVKQFFYAFAYAGTAAFWDYIMSTYTNIENHLNWNPVKQFLILFIGLLACRWFVAWMFKQHFPDRGLDDAGY
ncbi:MULTISPECIES: CBO0543 family protein [unclassified Paenibacillus]|uniref:CBO0543 family protein n=1 Tax=unclassified Paenibacillus TaxID=185978 RepID=UPI00363E96C7